MAGRVLRDSKGRYAGSTTGWGRGRSTHGGGFGGGVKGKTRSVRAQRNIQIGKSIGVKVGKAAMINAVGIGAAYGAQKAGISPNKVAYAGLGLGTAYVATRKIVKRTLR